MIAMNYVFTATHQNPAVRQFTDEPIVISCDKPNGSYYADHTFFGTSMTFSSPTEAIRSLINRRGFTLTGCMPVVEHTAASTRYTVEPFDQTIDGHANGYRVIRWEGADSYIETSYAGVDAKRFAQAKCDRLNSAGQALRNKQAEVDRICDKLTGLQREMGVLRDALNVAEQERDALREIAEQPENQVDGLRRDVEEMQATFAKVRRVLQRRPRRS